MRVYPLIVALLAGVLLLTGCAGSDKAVPVYADGDEDIVESPEGDDADMVEDANETELADESDIQEIEDTESDEADAEPAVHPCGEATERMGFDVCITEFASVDEYSQWAIEDTSSAMMLQVAKYMVPANQDAPLPTLLHNVQQWPFHFDFMREAFPQWYASLTADGYADLLMKPDARQYFAGALVKLSEACHGLEYGFSVYAGNAVDDIGHDDMLYIAGELKARFGFDDLLYVPASALDQQRVDSWPADGIAVADCSPAPDFEVYTPGTAYGYVRVFNRSTFEDAVDDGEIGWRDIVVLDHAPFDLPMVVSGVVTAEAQGILSHINVRCGRRGTPNFYLKDGPGLMAQYENLLVKLTVSMVGYTVEEAGLSEAEAWWSLQEPDAEPPVAADFDYTELPSLYDIPVETAAERETAKARVGGKAGNLAVLFQGMDSSYGGPAFAIPMHYYRSFMQSNTLRADIGNGEEAVTYEAWGRWITGNEALRGDLPLRRQMLDDFNDTMRDDGDVDQTLVDALVVRIAEIFGSQDVLVRFRSSSTLEDSLEFSGAGLYESTNACAADSVTLSADGSLCAEAWDSLARRTLQRALKKVWASFWLPRAFEERSYYGFDNVDAMAMGVLVTRSFRDEAVNGVAFTGLPFTGLPFTGLPYSRDQRMLITSQAGDVSVVSPENGEVPETALLTIDDDNTVADIARTVFSSLLPAGTWVVDDAEYNLLGGVLADIRQWYPIDADAYEADDIVFDLEFKLDRDRQLFIKQIRPFLRLEPEFSLQGDFHVVVPADMGACGQFVDFRTPQEEYQLKTLVSLNEGVISVDAGELPTAHLITAVQFGPEQTELLPVGDPLWEVEQASPQEGIDVYRYTCTTALLGDGVSGSIRWQTRFETRHGAVYSGMAVIDAASLLKRPNGWEMAVEVQGTSHDIALSACDYGSLPLYTHRAVMDNGDALEFRQRYQPVFMSTGPAALEQATVTIGDVSHNVDGYVHLVYSADHHNWNQRFMAIIPQTGDVCAVQLDEPRYDGSADALVTWYDCDWQVLGTETPADYSVVAPEDAAP